MNHLSTSHSRTVLSQWESLMKQVEFATQEIDVNIGGQSLDVASVVAVARYGISAHLTDEALQTVEENMKIVQDELEQGKVVYGVNTGFGGSADTKILEMNDIQGTIIRELHCGILAPTLGNSLSAQNAQIGDHPLSLSDVPTYMPESWARASMVIRVNSLASGYSGVRPVLVQSILDLLRNNIIPLIPLRGSISASGDLMPLSYIAGAIQGDPSIRVWAGSDSSRSITTADVALKNALLSSLVLGPKEGLAIVNGTAVSTGVAALAIQDVNCLAVLSQILTSMSVEALLGTTESFEPLFAKVRPHPGQIEVSRNIHSFLTGSKLARFAGNVNLAEGSLYQDRYSLRTASQWIGPVLEDLQLAYQQVSIECNSVTDNPLVDMGGNGRILNGGNFQARAITSAMEKTRQGMQTIGQILFAQCTELMNPSLSQSLPPNLAADEPTQSWLLKPLDIMTAALQSELGFLSNPAGSHVQPAEMGNQAINSLALISARYTHTALEVLSQLAAAHLFALCQALDLRAMHIKFLGKVKPILKASTVNLLESLGALQDMKEGNLEILWITIWSQFKKKLDETVKMESSVRFKHILKALQPLVLEVAIASADGIICLQTWAENSSKLALESYIENRCDYFDDPDATNVLGVASYRMYQVVRQQLGVPFLHIKTTSEKEGAHMRKETATVGGCVTLIYNAIRNGRMYKPVMDCLKEVGWDK